jgi:hypothetical protein
VRVSTDAGQTFGLVINLGMNGTITTMTNTAKAEGEAAEQQLLDTTLY